MRKVIVFHILILLIIPLISCMFYGLTDNIVISKFECSLNYESSLGVSGNNLIVSRPKDPILGPSNGFSIIDISSPFLPEPAGYFAPDIDVTIDSFMVIGSYVYCLTAQTLLIIDITSSNNPELIGELGGFNPEIYSSENLVVDDNYLYCGNLVVIDITNPASPVVVSETILNSGKVGAIDGKKIYSHGSIDDEYYIAVIDVNNPLSPTVVKRSFRSDFTMYYPWVTAAVRPDFQLVVHDSVAYVSGWGVYGAVAVVDFTDLMNPSIVDTLNINYFTDMDLYDESLYITGYRSTIQQEISVFDLTVPLKPSLLSPSGNISETILNAALDENYIYLASPQSIFICYRQNGK